MTRNHYFQFLLRASASKKLVIFDFDGTMVHLDIDWSAVKNALSSCFLKQKKCSSSLNDLFYYILMQGRYNLSRAYQIVLQLELINIDKVRKNQLIWNFLNLIPYKKKAIFSNNFYQTIITALSILDKNLVTEIDCIESRDMVKRYKPDAEGLYNIMDYFHFSPEDILFIGNSKSDALAGESAGIKTIILP